MRALLIILVYGLIAPRRAAERTQDAGRGTVWFAHLFGIVLGTTGILAVWYVTISIRWTARPGFQSEVVWAPQLWDAVAAQFLAVGLASCAAGFAATGIATLIALPFAWRDEPMADTLRQALRTVRLFAPVLGPLAAGTVASVVAFSMIPGSGPRPLHLLLMLLWSLLPLACLRTIGGACAADRPVNTVEHEPLCETCGYLLSHVPDSRRCPECGESVERALDPRFRWYPPAPGARRTEEWVFDVPFASAWTQPQALFARVRLNQPARPLIRQAAIAHFLSGLVVCLGFIVGLTLIVGGPNRVGEVIAVAGACSALTVGLFGLWFAGVGVVGLLAGRLYGRNLIRAAMIVAAHLSGFLVVAASVAIFSLMVLLYLGQANIINNPFWPVTGWLSLIVGLAIFYVAGVWRRMRLVRYGNWHFPERADRSDEAVRVPAGARQA